MVKLFIDWHLDYNVHGMLSLSWDLTMTLTFFIHVWTLAENFQKVENTPHIMRKVQMQTVCLEHLEKHLCFFFKSAICLEFSNAKAFLAICRFVVCMRMQIEEITKNTFLWGISLSLFCIKSNQYMPFSKLQKFLVSPIQVQELFIWSNLESV